MPIINLRTSKILLSSAILVTAIAGTTACSYTSKDSTPKVNSLTPTGTFAGSYYEKNSFTDKEGKYWIPLKPAVASIGFRMKDDTASGGYTKLGYSDVMYMLRPDSSQVFSLGQKITLPDVPVRREGQIYITPTALSKLLQTEVGWNPVTGEINIATPSDRENTEDSAKVEAAKPLRIQSVSNVDTGELVSYAKNFSVCLMISVPDRMKRPSASTARPLHAMSFRNSGWICPGWPKIRTISADGYRAARWSPAT